MSKKGFKCPHCGVLHKEYVRWGKISSPRCMKCNKLVAVDLIPSEYVQHRSKKRAKKRGKFTSLFKKKRGKDTVAKGERGRKKKKLVKSEEGRKEKEKEKKKKASLFITPKRPHEILEEILIDFGCKERFIDAMVRRSERTGEMHPGDLRHYLLAMNSGIGTKGQADFISEEYALALNDERDKAPRLDHKRTYPVERREHERYEPPSRVRRRAHHAGYPREISPTPPKEPQEPQRARREREKRISRADVRELVEDTLERREQKREREEILRNMGNRITRIESDMANIPNQISDGMSKVLKERQAKTPEEITKADVNNAVNNATLNLEKKYIEKDFKKSMEEGREKEKDFQKIIEDLSKERNELLKELSSQRATEPSGYQTDSGRVIGEAVSGLKDVIETRQPVKIAIEGIPKLLYPEMNKWKKERAPELKEERTNTTGGGVSRFLDKDYVEEQEI